MTSLRIRILCGTLLAGMAGILTPGQAVAATKCPEIVMPVCAVNPAGMRETYTNACFARVAHARILHAGRCTLFCFEIVKPVCARNPTTHKPQTYPNLCTAEHANATFLYDGKCR